MQADFEVELWGRPDLSEEERRGAEARYKEALCAALGGPGGVAQAWTAAHDAVARLRGTDDPIPQEFARAAQRAHALASAALPVWPWPGRFWCSFARGDQLHPRDLGLVRTRFDVPAPPPF